MMQFILVLLIIALNTLSSSAADCDIRLWVRADDLHPASVTEGDARLVNRLTASDGDGSCRIVSWRLGLRHRERAALKYMLSKASQLAEAEGETASEKNASPATIKNDSTDDVQASMLEASTLGATTKLQQRIATANERKRKAHPKYVSHDWAVFEEEHTAFDAQIDMGSVEEEREGFQVVEATPFIVVVPPVDLAIQDDMPSAQDRRWTSYSYHSNLALSYYGLVTLANGTQLEVEGGETTFLPQSIAAVSAPRRKETVNLNAKSKCTSATLFHSMSLSELALAGLEINATVEFMPVLVQGQNYILNGTITRGNDKFEVKGVNVRLDMQREMTWARAQLEKGDSGHRAHVLSEMDHQQEVEAGRGGGGRRLQMVKPAAKHLLRALTPDISSDCRALSCQFAALHWPWSQNSRSKVDAKGAFRTWVNVSDVDTVTNRPSAFEITTAKLVLEVAIVNPKEREKQNRRAKASNRSELIDMDTKQSWVSETRLCNLEEKEAQHVRIVEVDISSVEIQSRSWERLARTSLGHLDCNEIPVLPRTSADARAPILALGQPDVTSLSRACHRPESFPLISEQTKVNTSHYTVREKHHFGTTSNEQIYKKHCHTMENTKGLKGGGCQSVGRIWAERVIAPLRKEGQL